MAAHFIHYHNFKLSLRFFLGVLMSFPFTNKNYANHPILQFPTLHAIGNPAL